MSSTNYLLKQADSAMTTYCHKKFAKHTHKRKHEEVENKEISNSIQTILDLANKEVTQLEQCLPKRKQTKTLFRPWLEEGDKKKSNQINKELSQAPKRNRQHLAHLIHQYNQQAQLYLLQQQILFYQQQHVAANLRNTFYQQNMQQMALQQQQRPVFVFGQQ